MNRINLRKFKIKCLCKQQRNLKNELAVRTVSINVYECTSMNMRINLFFNCRFCVCVCCVVFVVSFFLAKESGAKRLRFPFRRLIEGEIRWHPIFIRPKPTHNTTTHRNYIKYIHTPHT
jgi:hypothetical protein